MDASTRTPPGPGRGPRSWAAPLALALLLLTGLPPLFPGGPARAGGLTPGLDQAPGLPPGMEIVDFVVTAPPAPLPGDRAEASFGLRNTSEEIKILDQGTGMFVAARKPATPDDDGIRDFGQGNGGEFLRPGETLRLRATVVLDSPGAWTFWPSFALVGRPGSARVLETTLVVLDPDPGRKTEPGLGSGRAQPTRPGTGRNAADRRDAGKAGRRVMVLNADPEPESAGDDAAQAPDPAPLSVAALLAEPARHDGRVVAVSGTARVVRVKADATGRLWTFLRLADPGRPRAEVTVFAPGRAAVSENARAEVRGVFRVRSQRGRTAYANEIDAREGVIRNLSP